MRLKTCTTRAKKTAAKQRARRIAKGTQGRFESSLIRFAGYALGALFGGAILAPIIEQAALRAQFRLVKEGR